MKKILNRYTFLSFIYVSVLTLITYQVTHSYFSGSAQSSTNTFSAATQFPTPTPNGTATSSAALVINEVYYDPDETHTVGGGPDADNNSEWIEIYNPTSSTVNLKDWKITDNSGSEKTVTTSNRNLGPSSFVILAKAANVRTAWGIDESIFIPIGENFGNGLANDGDRIILKDSFGTTIDQMSYGSDTTALNPSATDVAEGHSLERDPDGTDANTAADFVDRTSPQPGL